MSNQDRFIAGETFTMDGIAYKLVFMFGQRYIHAENIDGVFHYVAMVARVDDQGIHWATHIMDTLLQGFTAFDKLTFPPDPASKGGETP